MTKQEIYDTVCAHLAQQKRRAFENGSCRYRTSDGLKCAIGCLIPDDLYDPRMDDPAVNIGVVSLLDLFPLDPIFGDVSELFLASIQNAHDRSGNQRQLCHSLRNIAIYGCVTPGAEEAITEWTV